MHDVNPTRSDDASKRVGPSGSPKASLIAGQQRGVFPVSGRSAR